jgi:hypothetical protein
MMYAVDRSSRLARTNGLAVVRRPRLTPEGRAAWIQSCGCVGSMCEGAAASNWVSKHYSMPRFGFRAFFLDWVHGFLICVADIMMALSSIKMGAPASREGTWHHFWTYEASNCCTFAANRHSRCFTELARTAILAIGYSMLRTGKRPIADSYHVSSANSDALPEIAVTHPPDTFCAVYGRA